MPSLSLKTILPWVGFISFKIILNSVDLPVPLSPLKSTFSPALISISGYLIFSPLGYWRTKPWVERVSKFVRESSFFSEFGNSFISFITLSANDLVDLIEPICEVTLTSWEKIKLEKFAILIRVPIVNWWFNTNSPVARRTAPWATILAV